MAVRRNFFRVGPNVPRFRRVYGISDFGITANVTVQPGDYGKVGSVTIPAQQYVTFGATEAFAGGATGTPAYISIRDSSDAAISGSIRLVLSNATGTRTETIKEERTERFAADQSDRNKAVLLPEFPLFGGEDDKLIIQLKPDSATAVTFVYNATSAKFLVPVTVIQ